MTRRASTACVFISVFDAAPDAIIAVDADGIMQLANRRAELLFGYATGELIGQPLDVLVPDAMQAAHARHRAAYTADPTPRIMALGMMPAGRRKDGTEFPVGVSLSSVRTTRGTLVLAGVRDISHRIRAEAARGHLEASVRKDERAEERASLEDQLHQAQRLESVGQLAGGVAHDFNSLLAGIMNYAGLVSETLAEEVLKRDLSGDPVFVTLADDVRQIMHVARRAAVLTRQLLIFSRRTVVQVTVLDLNAVVGDMQELLRRTMGENVDRLRTTCAPDLPLIKADRGQVDQVLMNLALNARDAMPDGGQLSIDTCRIEIGDDEGRVRGVEPGVFARLTVSDTGTGMGPEVVAHAFDPFFTTKPEGKGTGLGLATVHGIVREAGGDVSIDSTAGSGTTVCVDLPATSDPLPGHVGAQPEVRSREGGETVLLVEDEAIVRQPAQRVLEKHGYRVLAAPDAATAMEIASEHPGTIDLLLTDVVMPGRSGVALSHDLAELRPATRVLFMSGYTYDDATVHARQLDAGVALIEKPFAPADLLRKIRAVLDGDG